MKHLYVSDLDGTLLNELGQVSKKTRQKLLHLLADGVDFTIASARSLESIRGLFSDFPINLPVIEHNGAMISELKTGQHHFINAISKGPLEKLYRRLVKLGHHPFLVTYDGQQDRMHYRKLQNEGYEWYLRERQRLKDPRLNETKDLEQHLEEQVISVTVIGRGKEIERLRKDVSKYLPGQFMLVIFENPYDPGWFWLQFQALGSNKGRGLEKVLEFTGHSIDETTVFGDAPNDIHMFEVASHRIAVENAHDHIKLLASRVIGPHHEDSVIQYIELDFEKRGK